MCKSPSVADKSVLLDYISTALPLVLWRSCRHQDWAVLIASIGLLLYKLLIILSTGLFALQPIIVRHEGVAMSTRNQFNGTGAEARLDAVEGLPLYITYGAQTQGISYPHGTDDKYAIQSFDTVDASDEGATRTARVNTFEAEFGCEPADLNMIEWRNYHTAYLNGMRMLYSVTNFSLAVGDCRVSNLTVNSTPIGGETSFLWQMSSEVCDHEHEDHRVALVLLKARADEGENNTAVHLLESASLLCKPSYAVRRASVSYSGTISGNDDALSVDIDSRESSSKIPGLNDTAFVSFSLSLFGYGPG